MEIFGDYRFLSAGGFFTAFLCLILGILVFLANPRSSNCRIASAFNLAVAWWAFFYAMIYLVRDDPFGLFISQATAAGTFSTSVLFTHFILSVLKKTKQKRKFLIIDYSILAVLLVLNFSTKLMIVGSPPKLDLPSFSDAGPLYILAPIYLFSNVIFSFYHLILGIQETRGYRKNQLVLFMLSTLIGYMVATPGFLLVFDIPMKPVTTPLLSIYPLMLTYAVVKHRFLDITKLVKNTLIFSLLFGGLLGFVSIALFVSKEGLSRWIGISEPAAQAVAIALAIALYGPLKTGLSRLTNRLLFQHLPNPEIIFTKLSEDIMHVLDGKKLAEEVTNRVANILALDRIGFYIRSRTNSTLFELSSSVGRLRKKQIHQSKQLIQYLEHTRDYLVTPHSLEEARRFLCKKPFFALQNIKEVKRQASMELAALGGVAAFPVFVRDTLRAVLVTGRKKSDAPWNEEEFQILKSFTRHLSLALGNADYAEEIQRFREKLFLSERDASAGALIAAVDHEVNSTIHGMSLNLTTLSRELSNPKTLARPREKVEEVILGTMESVLRGGAKINGIIQHLSDLAERKPLSIDEDVRPFEIADRIIQELGGEEPRPGIHIQLNIPKTLRIACDPDGLYEILVNLIRNARQAIEGDGEILIESAVRNGGAILQVRDTGVGIPGECLEHIFEPFFTTKTEKQGNGQQGTGMGLFIVKEYMQAFGGRVEVQSKVGLGTVFSLYFPNLEPALAKGTK